GAALLLPGADSLAQGAWHLRDLAGAGACRKQRVAGPAARSLVRGGQPERGGDRARFRTTRRRLAGAGQRVRRPASRIGVAAPGDERRDPPERWRVSLTRIARSRAKDLRKTVRRK